MLDACGRSNKFVCNINVLLSIVAQNILTKQLALQSGSAGQIFTIMAVFSPLFSLLCSVGAIVCVRGAIITIEWTPEGVEEHRSYE